MKQILYTIMISMIMLLGAAQSINAHNKPEEGWKDKMMSEKIGFITMELNITPEEAQTFWPVYNKVEKELDMSRFEVIKAYKALADAVDADKPAKEIATLLDKYLEAKTNQDKLDNSAAQTYKEVLPVEKVAKLYVAEEKFRRQYITKLHKRPEDTK